MTASNGRLATTITNPGPADKVTGRLGGFGLTMANDLYALEILAAGAWHGERPRPRSPPSGSSATPFTAQLSRPLTDRFDLQVDLSYTGLKVGLREGPPGVSTRAAARSAPPPMRSRRAALALSIGAEAPHRYSPWHPAGALFAPGDPGRRTGSLVPHAAVCGRPSHRARVAAPDRCSPWCRLLASRPTTRAFPGTADPTGDGALSAESTDALYWSPSLGAKWEAWRGSFSGRTAAATVRPPALGELFGYSGAVRGNRILKRGGGYQRGRRAPPTSSRTGGPLSSLRFDGAGFRPPGPTTSSSTSRASQEEVRPKNVSSGDDHRLRGGGAPPPGPGRGLGGQLQPTSMPSINRTRAVTTSAGGCRTAGPRGLCPGRGADKAAAIRQRHLGRRRILVGHIYLNQANQAEHTVPMRLLLGCGYRLSHEPSGVSVTLEFQEP